MARAPFFITSGLCVFAAPIVAFASPAFQNDIPNGLAVGCVACHVQNNDQNRNVFGSFVEANMVGGLPSWPALFDTDSDGDGQTNGEELGDPCGTWRKSRPAPRTTNISNPGRANSTSTTPDEPSCAPPDAGVVDLGPPDTGVRDTGMVDLGRPDTGVDSGPRDTGFVFPPDAGLADAGFEVDDGGCRCLRDPVASPWSSFAALLMLGFALRRRAHRA